MMEAPEKNIWEYSVGNLANNLIFLFVGTYVMYFYTNILGVSALVAGTIFMVARLIDAVTDPLMGMIVDRTNTKRFGKYRGFIIFGSPFLGIIFVLMFTTPNLSVTGKVIYAYICYIMYSLAWTVVQIPQLALPIILSNDVAKRTRIQAIFQAFGSIGNLVITSFVLPLLDLFGGQDNSRSWFVVSIIIAVISTVLFIVSAQSAKRLDVYRPYVAVQKEKEKKHTLKETFSVITQNRALICVLIAYGTDMFAYQISTALRMYFFKYNMGGRTDLINWLGYVGLVVSFVLVPVIKPMVAKAGKRKLIIGVESLAILFTLPLLFGSPNVAAVMFTYIAITITFNFNNLVSRSAVLDSANYAQLKTGRDGSALVNSTFTFVNKCCQAFSMFFAGAILSSTGYNAKLTQQGSGTLQAILYLTTLLPIAGYICSLIAMKYYPMDRAGELKMEQEIKALRLKEKEVETSE